MLKRSTVCGVFLSFGLPLAALAAPPSSEVQKWSTKAVERTGSDGFKFSDPEWNDASSFPIAEASVLFHKLYGEAFSYALATSGRSAGCGASAQTGADIYEQFVTYITTGELKSAISNQFAVSVQIAATSDAVTAQSRFVATPEFSVGVQGNFLVSKGISAVGDEPTDPPKIQPSVGPWTNAVALAAAKIASENLDAQFDPIGYLDSTFLGSTNVLELKSRLQGFAELRIDSVLAVWGENGSRVFSRVVNNDVYLIVDTAAGKAFGPYAVDKNLPYVGDALVNYPKSDGQTVVVAAVPLPCAATVPWTPATTPKPTYWPPTMPPWVPVTVPPTPPASIWTCVTQGVGRNCKCTATRSASCNCGWIFCDTCEERVVCVWFPSSGVPGEPAACGGAGLPNPPTGNAFCNEDWRVY